MLVDAGGRHHRQQRRAGRQEEIDGDQELEAREAVGGKPADGAEQQVEDIEQEAGDRPAGPPSRSSERPARRWRPAGSRRRSPPRCGRRRRGGSAAWQAPAAATDASRPPLSPLACPGRMVAAREGEVATRVGLPPHAPIEGTPLELPAFLTKKRAVWRVSRQRGCGAGPAREAKLPPLDLLPQHLELEPTLLGRGELRLGGAQRLARLREGLPVAGIQLRGRSARSCSRRAPACRAAICAGRVSSACFSWKLRRRFACLRRRVKIARLRHRASSWASAQP